MRVMADGLNNIRSMRIAEIITDYRNIQQQLASIRTQPSAEEYNEDGYVILRTCVGQAQQLLQQPFQGAPSQGARDEETVKRDLKRIILDASVRRFKAQKLYLRASAAMRWVQQRQQILQGQRPHAGHAPALQQIRNNLRSELQAITDARVEASLLQPDTQARKWLAEDPPLAVIQRAMGNGN